MDMEKLPPFSRFVGLHMAGSEPRLSSRYPTEPRRRFWPWAVATVLAGLVTGVLAAALLNLPPT